MNQPKVLTTCPHCGAVMMVRARSLKVKPVRRCPRCGRGYSVETVQVAS